MTTLLIITIVIIVIWIRYIQETEKINKNISKWEISTIWDTLLENNVLDQNQYEEAMRKGQVNFNASMVSQKKKEGQLKALRDLVEKE